MLWRFLIYGLLGWGVEVLFTGTLALLQQRDRCATAKTYLWMFPIYGGALLLLEQVEQASQGGHFLARALAYLLVIYGAELLSGWLLRQLLGRCPWDYTGRGHHLFGLINLDYAPAWFAAALLFEPAHAAVARAAAALGG